jgi:hypothetical protein
MKLLRALVVSLSSVVLAPGGLRAEDSAEPEKPRTRSAREMEAVVKEYCQRASQVRPLDAEEHFRLGQWCLEGNLPQKAEQWFLEALRIDSDHAGARAALGYERYGTGWRKGSERASTTAPVQAPAAVESKAPPTTVAQEPAAVDAKVPEPSPGTTESESPADSSSTSAEFQAEVDRKKAWATEAFAKFQVPFVTHEDADFLVHTTFPSVRHARVQNLLLNLRYVKKLLVNLLGLRGRELHPWPAKVQIVFLRAEEEYERFGQFVEGVDNARNPEGGYTAGEHTVLWRPNSEVIARALATSAIERLNGSDRWIAWWLTEGLAERVLVDFVAAQKTEGQPQRPPYERDLITAADAIKNGGDGLTVFSLLESPQPKSREQDRNRALAMTLVDFFLSANARGFQNAVRALKSDKAPAPPSSDSEDEFKSFYLNYLAFQTETLQTQLRVKMAVLDEGWKSYVQKKADALKGDAKPSAAPKPPKR